LAIQERELRNNQKHFLRDDLKNQIEQNSARKQADWVAEHSPDKVPGDYDLVDYIEEDSDA